MNNLIGISGKIGSGKDAVGKILQAFSTEGHVDRIRGDLGNDMLKDSSIIKPVLNGNLWYGLKTYEIKKYADKLKDIVCLLIGCTREQLEDREFKEKELGEEWDKVVHNAYSFFEGTHEEYSQFIRDTEAIITNREPFQIGDKMSFEYRLKEERTIMTPRLLLQLLGTDCGRDIIHPSIWVNALFTDYRCPIDERANIPDWESKWIVTDVRFENEAQAIKDRGGIIIRVERPINLRFPKLWKLYTSSNKFVNKAGKFLAWSSGHDKEMWEKLNHPSETALDNYEFDHVIDNNGSLDELVEKVKQLNLV